MPRVVYTDPSGVRREVAFKTQLRIGRHPNQDLQILDRVVSKAHALMEVKNGTMTVADVGSRNGTVLNGEPVSVPVPVSDG
ncbi:MAG: pSer/pThr/pTyr-binding forkhead associated (FHA) protein, partial [Flavobacteriales bacterium]